MPVYVLEKDDGNFLDVVGYAESIEQASDLVMEYFCNVVEPDDGDFELRVICYGFGLNSSGKIAASYKIFNAENILEKRNETFFGKERCIL